MSSWRGLALAIIILLGQRSALADEPRRVTPSDAYVEISRTAELQKLLIDGDLDVAKLTPPQGAKRIVIQDVKLDGALRSSAGGPPVALEIRSSDLRDLDLRGTRWSAPLVIEDSTIRNRAWFDEAQFDASFVLHNAVFSGQAQFRHARFSAPVEITSSSFRPPPALAASVNFTGARFSAPARFDRSDFASGVRFDSARFDADASFLGLKAQGRTSLHNVIFAGDAEFRFCKLGDIDFGHIEQMSVFMRMADFRGCAMNSLRLDYADMRGDVLLVNAEIAPGNLTLTHASLRGARNDFSGLKVAGKLDLKGAQIANLQLQWSEIGPPLQRSSPGSDVLRPLQLRLEELKKDGDARDASAVLADVVIEERLALPDTSFGAKAMLWFERIVWGGGAAYGTRLERVIGVAILCWLALALPLLLFPGVDVRPLLSTVDKTSLHEASKAEALEPAPASPIRRALQKLAYAFGLMFTMPDLRLRPVQPISTAVQSYLLAMRAIGLCLIALMALTLAKVSPIMQALLGKITG